MADVKNYQCPSCTGPLHFDETEGKLHCDYCGSSYTVEEYERLTGEGSPEEGDHNAKSVPPDNRENEQGAAGKEDHWDTSQFSSDWGEERSNMRTYSCPSCGAELFCEETTAATRCPYCGNPSIVQKQFEKEFKPDYVIPFRLTKESAIASLKTHYKGKLLLPKSFVSSNHLEEVQGLYVPFWLYNSDVDVDCNFHATRVRTYVQGNYDVREVSHYQVQRSGNVSFSKIPADGSKKMPDDYMDSIEPFDYSDLKPFSMAYMPGFLADRYDVTAEDNALRADRRSKNSALDVMRADVKGYTTVTLQNETTRIHRGRVFYALLPVWTLHTKWQDKDYLFMMNGQTGRMVGDLPIDEKKFWLIVIAIFFCGGILLSVLGIGSFIFAIFMDLMK